MTNEELETLSHSYWSQRAEEFSGLRMRDFDTPMHQAFRVFLQQHFPRRETVHALDAGCGAGFFSLILRELGCQVTAVDFSAAMLEQARKNSRNKGLDGITFLERNVQDLQLPDESFDFVVSRNVTWVLTDAGRAYREMVRVLRPGGRLLNMDANYGRTFNEADARGETPVHPTQTREQLRLRNRLSRDLDVTRADRPQWDLLTLWDLGVSSVHCYRDLDTLLNIENWNHASTRASGRRRSEMFAVLAEK